MCEERAHPWAGGYPLILLMLSHTIKSEMLVSLREQASDLQEIKFALPPVSMFSSAFEEKLSVCPRDHFAT